MKGFQYIPTIVAIFFSTSNTAMAQAQTSSDAAAASDGGLREIIVTAERRVSTAQRAATAVSVRSGDDLLAQGRYSLENILEDVPGVNGGSALNSGTARAASDNPAAGLVIRGIQSNLGTGGSSLAPAASAALYIDDVYNGIGSNYDIDRVEVLRGPQGTLYGRSATSGVVAVHTKAADLHDLGGTASFETGNYGLFHAAGALNVPVIDDRLALRVSANHHERDSFYSKSGGGRRVTNEGRAKLSYKPSENFAAMLGVAFQDNRIRSDGVTINQIKPDQFQIISTDWVPSWNKYRQVWGVFDLDLGGVNVTYIPAYRNWKQESAYIQRGGTSQLDQIGSTPKDYFHTQELRVRSKDESWFQWQSGLMYYDNGIKDFSQVNYYPTGALAFRSYTEKQTTALGAFAETRLAFTPTARLTAGIRYDHTKVVTEQDYTSAALITKTLTADEGTRKFNNVTFKLRMEQDLTPANLLYASVSTGFTPGDVGVTTNAALQPEVAEFKAQTLTAYEIGSKNRFAGGRIQLNGAAYYYDYGGYQVANINLTPGSPSRTFRTIAVPVTIYGTEIELQVKPWRSGEFSANFAYTNAKYHNIPTQYNYLFAFDKIPGVPPYEVNASYTHSLPIADGVDLRLTGDVRYSSAHYVTRIPDSYVQYGALDYAHVSGKTLGDLNATLSIADGRYSLTGYVRNVTDERFKVYRPGLGTAVDSATATSVGSTVTLSDPRTYGIVATARF